MELSVTVYCWSIFPEIVDASINTNSHTTLPETCFKTPERKYFSSSNCIAAIFVKIFRSLLLNYVKNIIDRNYANQTVFTVTTGKEM